MCLHTLGSQGNCDLSQSGLIWTMCLLQAKDAGNKAGNVLEGLKNDIIGNAEEAGDSASEPDLYWQYRIRLLLNKFLYGLHTCSCEDKPVKLSQRIVQAVPRLQYSADSDRLLPFCRGRSKDRWP